MTPVAATTSAASGGSRLGLACSRVRVSGPMSKNVCRFAPAMPW
jgi:hypothetical protein